MIMIPEVNTLCEYQCMMLGFEKPVGIALLNNNTHTLVKARVTQQLHMYFILYDKITLLVFLSSLPTFVYLTTQRKILAILLTH